MPGQITLPAELTPTDGRFGSGPTRVRPEAIQALAAAAPGYMGTSHRAGGVRSVVEAIRTGLRELYRLEEHEVVMGVGGATLFWDMAIISLIQERSQHTVIGEFSSRFAEAAAAAPHLEPPVEVRAEPGSWEAPGDVAGVDTHALIHNETSTGVLAPLQRPGDGLVLIDAVSAAGATLVDPGVFDAYYFSPQKAFGADGGLWVALLSPAAIERAERLSSERAIPPMLDLSLAITNSRLDQTLNTPALATLFLLADSIGFLLEQGGLEWADAHCRIGSGMIYEWAETSDLVDPFVSGPLRSHVTVTLDVAEQIPAEDVIAVLAANGIVGVGGYRKLGRNQLRIGVWPATPHHDVERLLASIDYVLERL